MIRVVSAIELRMLFKDGIVARLQALPSFGVWRGDGLPRAHVAAPARSEEHTSELQSRLHLVCRLLLEKKKSTCHRNRPRHRHKTTYLRRLTHLATSLSYQRPAS